MHPMDQAWVQLTLTAADPPRMLQRLNEAQIMLCDIRLREDGICLDCCVQQKDLKLTQMVAEKYGYDLKVQRFAAMKKVVICLKSRPLLLITATMLLLLSLFLPERILFVQVDGNEQIPTQQILEFAAEEGLYFGASRRQIRSEPIKNALLHAIEQLQWVGVNTHGCVAVIHVRERNLSAQYPEARCVCSLYATRDGVINRQFVTSGNCLIKAGQVVKKGELLVSGYEDRGLCIRATHSSGEIYAITEHSLTAVTPQKYLSDGHVTHTTRKYALLIGKNRINLYKDSGILGVGCDKIYKENYITLPGGFRLPIVLLTETVTFCQKGGEVVAADQRQTLAQFVPSYLLSMMNDGKICRTDTAFAEKEDFLFLSGTCFCEEMIAERRSEEIIKPYGNDE